MVNAHLLLVIIVTIFLVIIIEFQKLRNISWILTIGCIGYVFLSITPDCSELNINTTIDTNNTIVNSVNINDLEESSNNNMEVKEIFSIDKSIELIDGQNVAIEDNEIYFDTDIIKSVKVNTIAIAKSIQGKEPIDSGTLFLSDLNELFCHTGIDNPFNNNRIIHTWQYNGNDYLKSFLTVGNSANWRCWSRIAMNPDLIGDWSVIVSDATGNILDSIEFTIISTDD